ncbi:MAG: DUF3572 domain-containing protein [Hyphomicrobium sp.]
MAKPLLFTLVQAEQLGLNALTFLAEDGQRLVRFLSLTGTTPAGLRAGAGQPRMLAAVLGHLLEDEPLLLVFTSMKGIDPATIAPAHELLVRAANVSE